MDKEVNPNRLPALLLVAVVICLILYILPDSIGGIKIKKIDLLSDIRVKEEPMSLDSLMVQLAKEDELEADTTQMGLPPVMDMAADSLIWSLRDSIYQAMASMPGIDSLGVRFEDPTPGHTGLQRFFKALNNRHSLGRPVRVAFMGDSFIEGDILVADFRHEMQQKFGGRGVGFVPIHSVAAQYRPTINQKQEGWKMHSLVNNKKHQYTLSGLVFEVTGEKASLHVKTVDRYASLKNPSTMKFLYERNDNTVMHLSCNGSSEAMQIHLPAGEKIRQYVLNQQVDEVSMQFTDAEGFKALGVALEDPEGVIVDNYSIRGNSGALLQHLDQEYCEAFREVRPYDLIVLQYGLNVVSEDMLQYSWYRKKMTEVVNHLKQCFPDTDILLMGVSDRGRLNDGNYETMPAVLAVMHAQRQVSKNTQIPFWNTFGAMGGENSMVRYVNNNWASKDYTHMSFRGGKEIANALMNALLLEKEFYDKVEMAAY